MTRFLMATIVAASAFLAACGESLPTNPTEFGAVPELNPAAPVSAPTGGPPQTVWEVEGRISTPDHAETTDCPAPGAAIRELVFGAEAEVLYTTDRRFGGVLEVDETGQTLTGPASGFPMENGGWVWPVEKDGLYRFTCLRYGELLVLADLAKLNGGGYQLVELEDGVLAVHVL